MMSGTATVRLSESHHRLMLAIGDVIAKHTTQSPMAIDEIVGVLGFCAGAAIVKGCKSNGNRKRMRIVAVDNIDSGMDAMRRAVTGSSLILPGVN